MKGVNIQVIPHSEQRYETVGDWWVDEGEILQIRVSDMGEWKYEQLVAFHEYAEAMLCIHKGISEKSITEFDEKFEEIRLKHPGIIGDMEPGNMTSAPYNKQHRKATHLEGLLAQPLGVDWGEYGKAVNKLTKI